MPDWVDSFMDETRGMALPEPFRLWTALTIISGALERRVYTWTKRGHLYPNLFTILAGTPGSGKTLMVNTARNFWCSVPDLHLGPDDPTKASFLDCLETAVRTSTNGSGTTLFTALSVACREFGVLLPKYNAGFMNVLSDIYDNPLQYSSPRRTTKSVVIDRPNVNILAAVTPRLPTRTHSRSSLGARFHFKVPFHLRREDTEH